MSLKKFAEGMARGQFIPRDPYSHAYSLIAEDTNEDVKRFTEIINKQILLSNISSDKMLKLYQNDADLLVALLDMSRREPGLRSVFLTLYYQWKNELALTRVKGGAERKLQASASGYHPGMLSGFGSEYMQELEKEERENPLIAAFGKLGKGGQKGKPWWKEE